MYWMISANENKYDHVRAFGKWGFIDWKTYAHYSVGDIVYIYCSRTIKKVMYKTIVEKIDIPFGEHNEDPSLWLEKEGSDPSMKYTRLKLVRIVDRDELSLENIRKVGIKNGPERPMKLSNETVAYFEKYFSVGEDEHRIISFPCGDTYDLVKKTLIHAHPASARPIIENVPRFLMVRAHGGISDELYSIERTVEFNPLDRKALMKYNNEPFFNGLKQYIEERADSPFGFGSAPNPYRYYILKKVYSLKPAFVVDINTPGYRFFTFDEIGVDINEIYHYDVHKLYAQFYKNDANIIPASLAAAAKAHRSFVSSFPKESIISLKMEDYLISKEGYGNPNSFCRKLRYEIDAMGHMGDVRFNVFGVYISGGTEIALSDTLKKLFDNDIEKAFEYTKNEIVKLLDAFEKKKYDEIEKINLNSSFKYRLLMVYYPNDVIPVCTEKTLNGYCDSVGIKYDKNDEPVYRNMELVKYKNSIDELSGITNFEAMRFFDWLWRNNYYVANDAGTKTLSEENKTFNSHVEEKKYKVSKKEIEASEKEEERIKKDVDSMISSVDIEGSYEYVAVPEERRKVQESEKSIGVSTYPRDPQKRVNALLRAGFTCEFNPDHESFISRRTDKRYMETHHLIPLEYWESFDNSLDVEANIVCLCSNCHNEIHYGKYAENLIIPLYEKRKDELKSAGIGIEIGSLIEMYKGEYVKEITDDE